MNVDCDLNLYNLILKYFRLRMKYMIRYRFLIISVIIRTFQNFNDYSDDENSKKNQTSNYTNEISNNDTTSYLNKSSYANDSFFDKIKSSKLLLKNENQDNNFSLNSLI